MTFFRRVLCENGKIIQRLKDIYDAASSSSVTLSKKELEMLERWDMIVAQLERIHLQIFLLLGETGDQIDPGAVLLPKRGSIILDAKEEDEDLADLLHVRDEKAANTVGGTFTSGSWQTRTLNTVSTNDISGASLAANQITLPSGTYSIEARAPAFGGARHKAKLRDITGTTDLLIGSSEFSASVVDHVTSDSVILGRFTLSVQSDLEIQHQIQITQSSNGFGVESNFGVTEIYAEALIKKLA